MRGRTAVLVLILLGLAVAQEAAETPGQAAKRVLTARSGGGGLEDLAGRDDPDPWLVTEELLSAGEHEAAADFAKAGARKDTEKLPDYVARRSGKEPDVAARGAIVSAEKLYAEEKAKEAFAALEAVKPAGGDLCSIRVGFLRGLALQDLARLPESADAFLAAGEGAEKLGWLARAAESYHLAGVSLYIHSDFRRTLECWARRLAVEETRGNVDGKGRSLGNLAIVNGILGDYPKALTLHERSLEILERMGNDSKVADILNNIGVVANVLGDYPKAIKSFQRALDLYEELDNPSRVALALENIGEIHYFLGEFEEAHEALERSLGISEDLEEWLSVAYTLGHIGEVHLLQGAVAEARKRWTRSLDLFGKEGDRSGIALTHARLGDLYVPLKDETKVEEHHREALRIAEDIGDLNLLVPILRRLAEGELRRGEPAKSLETAKRAVKVMSGLVRGLAEQEGASARERWVDLFRVGIEAAAEVKDPAESCYFLESGRAGTLLEFLGGRKALQGAVVPQHLQKEEEAAREAEIEAVDKFRAALDTGKRTTIRDCRNELETARQRVQEVIEKIQRQAKSAASIVYPEAESLEQIRQHLGKGEVLVLYSLLGGQAKALVATPDAGRILSLGPTADIATACEGLALQTPDEDSGPALAALRKLVVAPLGLRAEDKRLLVSPHAILSYVPFALLAPDREIVYVPSGTTYGLLLAEREKKGEGVLALGDPDYAFRSGTKPLQPLPGTAKEVKAIGDEVLVKRAASETNLPVAIGARPRWRAVHLACHGLVDPERPMLSSLALTADEHNDGLVTTLDVFRMKIPADLVVLSACETGRGKVFKAEGVVGFTRAFMFAGAPRVVVSLWKVDDEATRELMVKFYELWKPGGRSTSEALKAAQEHVRSQQKWSHPYYWAAWQLWGLPD